MAHCFTYGHAMTNQPQLLLPSTEEINLKIMSALRLTDIDYREHKDSIDKATDVLLKKIFIVLDEQLGEEDWKRYDQLIETNAKPKVISNFLDEKIPDRNKITKKVIEDFLSELKKAAFGS